MFDPIIEAWRKRNRPVQTVVKEVQDVSLWAKVACGFVILAALKYLFGA